MSGRKAVVFGMAWLLGLSASGRVHDQKIQRGNSFAISHAIVVEISSVGEAIPICAMDVAGRQDLVPAFLKPTHRASQISSLPICEDAQFEKVVFAAQHTSLPLTAGLSFVAAQCALLGVAGAGVTALLGATERDAVNVTEKIMIGSAISGVVAGVFVHRLPFMHSFFKGGVYGLVAVVCGGGAAAVVYKIANPDEEIESVPSQQ